MQGRRIRVLIVDDSALMRQMLASALADDPAIEVIGSAPDPLIAREKIKTLDPDVVTLDIEMPKMDGLEFLRRLMTLRPTRVLMVSTLTARNSAATLAALELGAVDCLEKPVGLSGYDLEVFAATLRRRVRAVAEAHLSALGRAQAQRVAARPVPRQRQAIIAIGASTGGVEALNYVFQCLPKDLPPIAIVQHMPPNFTTRFAQRLDGASEIEVFEAVDGMILKPGQAVVAPGGFQLEIERGPTGYRCKVVDSGPVSGHAPSVDVLFTSVAEAAGAAALGVILTGMGHDGAQGLLAMRQAGAVTLAQDQASCLVYGMPRVAAELGAVMRQYPLEQIPEAIVATAAEAFSPGAALTS